MRVHFYLSRYGVVFLMILAAMLLAAINYDNNLVYIVLFMLIGLTVVSAVYTYRNITGLEIKRGHMWPVHAGDTLRYSMQVLNRSSAPIYGMTFKRSDLADEFRVACDYLPPGACTEVEFIEPANSRGRFYIREIQAASLFPLGLFRALVSVPVDWEYIVYPRLNGQRSWPDTAADARTQDDGHHRGGENFYGLRNYLPGESQRHIDWKAVARGRPLMVKEFASGGTGRLWFEWEQLGGIDTEVRLSQLAVWIVQADQVGVPYGLRLPDRDFVPATGPIHLRKCLTALALHSGRRS